MSNLAYHDRVRHFDTLKVANYGCENLRFLAVKEAIKDIHTKVRSYLDLRYIPSRIQTLGLVIVQPHVQGRSL